MDLFCYKAVQTDGLNKFIQGSIINKLNIAITSQIQQMQNSTLKLNPQLSVLNERNEFKKVDTDVTVMKNRVLLLKQQLQKQKETIKKNKNLTKQAIQKKIEVNKINQYKNKDLSSEQQKIQQLRQRNKSIRQSHNRELQDIQKAIYLVKLDDARQLKNISIQHSKKIKEMDRQFLSHQKERKQKVAQQSSKAKQKYMQFWKQKIGALYLEQAQNVMEISKNKQNKKKQLEMLQEEQTKLLQELNKFHSQQVQTKKQYLAALSLPVKDVAQAMGQSSIQKRDLNRSSLDVSQSRAYVNNSTLGRSQKSLQKQLKLPNTSVNEGKLKIILKQLKKMDRSSINTSR